MNCILRNCNIYREGHFTKGDLFLKGGIVVSSADMEGVSDVEIIDCGGAFLFPVSVMFMCIFESRVFCIKKQ